MVKLCNLLNAIMVHYGRPVLIFITIFSLEFNRSNIKPFIISICFIWLQLEIRYVRSFQILANASINIQQLIEKATESFTRLPINEQNDHKLLILSFAIASAFNYLPLWRTHRNKENNAMKLKGVNCSIILFANLKEAIEGNNDNLSIHTCWIKISFCP